MRIALIALAVLTLLLLAGGGWVYIRWISMLPSTSTEVVTLTPDRRARLIALRTEPKFRPEDVPPLYYTGAETPGDEATLNAAVNDLIDAVLARPDGPLPARDVADLIGAAGRRVSGTMTEDRDRAHGYMIEVWYILGFRGATGRFAYGDGFPVPPGYAEPLPPGWLSPDQPRPIGAVTEEARREPGV
ncbi:hypothetical protein [Brevundimonas sp.]|uniref:hypothetical protein n=1 Tax=Brevundimonas sp. TaxID=1871086 RepID=UPI002604B4C9|nr:hypothetical protein [Brevundimonas sp.]